MYNLLILHKVSKNCLTDCLEIVCLYYIPSFLSTDFVYIYIRNSDYVHKLKFFVGVIAYFFP